MLFHHSAVVVARQLMELDGTFTVLTPQANNNYGAFDSTTFHSITRKMVK